MFAPAFAAIANIFLWWLTLEVNERFDNEWLTTGMVLLSVTWAAMTMVEVWTYAHSHFNMRTAERDVDDEQD